MRIRVITRFKNEHFIEARERAGFATQTDMARMTSLTQSSISAYENFRDYPRSVEMRQRVETATGRLFEELFPAVYCDAVDRKLGRPVQRVLTLRELPEWTQPKMIVERSPEDLYDVKELKPRIMEALETLTERERKVLKMRFGIGEYGYGREHTLEEIAELFRLTRERIRAIEAKALRKLKHPSRSRELKPFAGPDRQYGTEPRCPDCGYATDSETALYYHCLNLSCHRERWMKPSVKKYRKAEEQYDLEGYFMRKWGRFGQKGPNDSGKKSDPLSDEEKVNRAKQVLKDFSKKA